MINNLFNFYWIAVQVYSYPNLSLVNKGLLENSNLKILKIFISLRVFFLQNHRSKLYKIFIQIKAFLNCEGK